METVVGDSEIDSSPILALLVLGVLSDQSNNSTSVM